MTTRRIVGYQLAPTVWIGGDPPNKRAKVQISQLHETVHRQTLDSGIVVKALRAGIFVFDLSGWKLLKENMSRVKGIEEFDSVVKDVVLQRVVVLNTHIACLHHAIWKLNGITLEKMVINPRDIMRFWSFEDLAFSDPIDNDFLKRVRLSYAGTYQTDSPESSRYQSNAVISLESVAASFHHFSDILSGNELDVLTMVDLINRSWKAFEDHNYNLSLISSWSVAETLVNEIWAQYIDQNRERDEDGEVPVTFINKDREAVS